MSPGLGLSPKGVALVTGGASGIGEACVKMYAKEDIRAIVLVDKNETGLARVEQELKAEHPSLLTLTISADLTKEDEVQAVFAQAVAKFQRIDYAVNCAGVTIKHAFEDFSTAEWDRIQNINLKAVFLCMREELRIMLKQDRLPNDYGADRQDRGVIVNIGSVCSFIALPHNASYNATKQAVGGLTKTMAVEHAANGIRCNAVCPGFISTPLIRVDEETERTFNERASYAPIVRPGKPEEMADVVAFLSSPRASFVHGHMLSADGGFVAR